MKEIKILYIEDDNLSFYFVKDLFRKKSEKKVELIRANNGEEAMKILRKKEIHLIFLDYCLPDINGLELMDKIKKEKNLPVIMITGFGDEKVATEAMKKGAIDYIVKWEEINELVNYFDSYINLAYQLKNSMTECNLKKRRNSLDIIHCLLKNAIGGIKKTRLLYKTNLNSKTFKKYLEYCLNAGYIKVRGKIYITTEKGMNALKKINDASEIII